MKLDLTSEQSIKDFAANAAHDVLSDTSPLSTEERIAVIIEEILMQVREAITAAPELPKRCPTCGGKKNDRREKQVGNGRMDFVTCNDPFHN